MSTRSSPTGDTRSGVGRQNSDPMPSGAAQVAPRRDGVGDDLGAGTEQEMLSRQARSTPSMADVRSDTLHEGEGEPR